MSNENRDEQGRYASGDGGGTRASLRKGEFGRTGKTKEAKSLGDVGRGRNYITAQPSSSRIESLAYKASKAMSSYERILEKRGDIFSPDVQAAAKKMGAAQGNWEAAARGRSK